MEEAGRGCRNCEVINITGVLAPAGTPAAIIDKLNAATYPVRYARQKRASSGDRATRSTALMTYE